MPYHVSSTVEQGQFANCVISLVAMSWNGLLSSFFNEKKSILCSHNMYYLGGQFLRDLMPHVS